MSDMQTHNSHALVRDFLSAEKDAPSLRDVEKTVAVENFHKRVNRISGNNRIAKVLVSIGLVLLLVVLIPFTRSDS